MRLEKEILGKIGIISIALVLLISAIPLVSSCEGIKFLTILMKANGERVSTPIAVVLEKKYYTFTIEKSNGNGEFFFFVPEGFFATSLAEWNWWYNYYDACKKAGITYVAEEVKPEYPNITLYIFGKEGIYIYNYTVVISRLGLFDTYAIEIILPNDFEPYQVPILAEQSFFAPLNTTLIELKWHQKYVPSWWNGSMWISDFGEERIVLTPFEYKWYLARLNFLEVCKIQKLVKVDDNELEEAKWIVSHSETYNPLIWGINNQLEPEELKYYNEILKKIWG
ncbi:MAG: hypothetical protein QXP52_00200 [Candidatus Aenigmatarchaeota archaeon]